MKRVLITGSNRGLGLALTRESLARGDRVFATCRHPDQADDLQALTADYPDQLTILRLDVTDEQTIDASAREVQSQEDGLDLLINNAGINPSGERPGSLDTDTMLHTFHVNAVGPMIVAQRHLDLLRAGGDSKVVNISSTLGSLTRKSSGGGYSYCGSKAALNMLTRTLAFDLRSDGITVAAIHPGWVRTDMGGSAAPLAPAESARGVLEVAYGLTPADTGKFYTYQGREAPW
jgi:NAD(P)-dependent dehydrogenase (short-subunit alcohol dehydrogenase family)